MWPFLCQPGPVRAEEWAVVWWPGQDGLLNTFPRLSTLRSLTGHHITLSARQGHVTVSTDKGEMTFTKMHQNGSGPFSFEIGLWTKLGEIMLDNYLGFTGCQEVSLFSPASISPSLTHYLTKCDICKAEVIRTCQLNVTKRGINPLIPSYFVRYEVWNT